MRRGGEERGGKSRCEEGREVDGRQWRRWEGRGEAVRRYEKVNFIVKWGKIKSNVRLIVKALTRSINE